ncbi:MAG: pseudouridine synthase [Phycisphaerae bacterium]|nr:pseudouridine synthase [Phycisphaerae bacterium]
MPFTDDDVVVAVKPPPLQGVGLDDEGGWGGVPIEEAVAASLRTASPSLRLIDPLDDAVSGVCILARNREAAADLVRQIREHTYQRTYLAIVRGAPTEAQGTIELAIGPDRKDPEQMRIGGPHARDAVTEWTLRDRFASFALLECRVGRERRHQVRLHLQAAGLPLAVDSRYGGGGMLLLSAFKADYHASRRHDERPLIARVSLHSSAVQFNHPRTGAGCVFEAEPARDFRAALRQLDKYGRLPAGPMG